MKRFNWRTKVLTEAQLEDWKPAGPVVFTNGCFDILHPGHVRTLEIANTLGAYLVVAINSDYSIRGYKQREPYLPEEARVCAVASLAVVNFVSVFETEGELFSLIKAAQPTALVKGEEWANMEVTGADLVLGWDGTVYFIRNHKNWSSTSLARGIRDQEPK